MSRALLERVRPQRLMARPSRWNARTLALLGVAAALLWSLVEAGILTRALVNPRGWTLAVRFARAATQPDLDPELLRLALDSTLITLAYAICSTVLSLAIGATGGILGSATWWQTALPHRRAGAGPWLVARAAMALPRAIHEIIWGLFFINIIGLDPLTAILAIAIPFGAISAKVFSEIIDETPRGPLRALQNNGASPAGAFLYGMLPQALPDLLSYAMYRFECAIRSATVLGLIGAGGLGYQILLSLQSLRYEQMWTFLYALLLLCAATDLASAALRRGLGTGRLGDIGVAAHRRSKGELRYDQGRGRALLIACALLIPWAFWYVGVDPLRLFEPRVAAHLARIAHEWLPPRLAWADLPVLATLARQTLSMSILAISIAGLGAMALSFPAARPFALAGGPLGAASGPWRRGAGYLILGVARGVLLVARAIAEPIWALLFLFLLYPGILPGALGLALYNLGILGRLMAEVAENTDQRPLRALQAQGAPPGQIFLYGALPQTLPRHLAYILYRWEVCIRATVVVGLVGGGGLGRLLTEQIARFDYRAVLSTLIVFVGLTFVVDLISGTVRRTIR